MSATSETIDAFHFGGFHIVQPKGRGHRAGMDAMLLASMVATEGPIRVADLGAGAGAAGMAVAARLDTASVLLVEKSADMVAFARKSLALPENARIAARIAVTEADVTLKGKARLAAGLEDDTYDHVIMNPPFNDASDRRAPDGLKAEAHAMQGDLFEDWIRTAGAMLKPGGQMSLIARPESIAAIIDACGRRFGGIEVTLIHPREAENAIRVLVSAIKGSRARLTFRSPLYMHPEGSHRFLADVDDLNNGRKAYERVKHARKASPPIAFPSKRITSPI
ncbi:methyltransferase [Rhizobium sp. KVB221]|uniref:Methyltransferase n=1 Tax=Rhizobium setariae TaxID=2801340 RepID=A0A936YM76_9HYPH|nr:methyltransferase [Rhizobium setariae]MBL0370766.1 methyltransferase [Rhizobium setariae]